MSSFREQLTAFTANVRATNQAVFVGVVQEAKRSIVEGSELTGAPGQQVDKGILKSSWIDDYPEPNVATITTNQPYAEQEEHGIAASGKPIVQHSVVGGPHSLKLTIAGFDRIVETVAAREAGSGGGSA